MPLYEYECSQCRKRIEKIQKFSDAELTVCPHCGGPLARTITAAAFSFAGGGWYKDGYGSVKPPSASGETTSTPAASSDSAASSSESAKPAAAPAAAPSAPAATATPGSTSQVLILTSPLLPRTS